VPGGAAPRCRRAADLGFWSRERADDDNPPVDERRFVEVPTWRHAGINFLHPLLRRGLEVIDTPGLKLALEPSVPSVARDGGAQQQDAA
jgi:hypothetical protein